SDMYTLSLHDALPISASCRVQRVFPISCSKAAKNSSCRCNAGSFRNSSIWANSSHTILVCIHTSPSPCQSGSCDVNRISIIQGSSSSQLSNPFQSIDQKGSSGKCESISFIFSMDRTSLRICSRSTALCDCFLEAVLRKYTLLE